MKGNNHLLINKNLYKTVVELLEDYHFDTQFKIVTYKMKYEKDEYLNYQIKRQNERVNLLETVIKNLKEIEQKSQE